MKLIRTEEAVGQVLCHDITEIVPGEKKGPVFRKGHVVTEADVPVLLRVGKEHLYVWEKEAGMLHEDEAAEYLRRICQGSGKTDGGMLSSAPKEGKIELSAAERGFFMINREALKAVNRIGEMMIATRHGDTIAEAGDKLAGTRVIPLVIEAEKMKRAEAAAKALSGGEPILKLLPFRHKKYAVVTTGSEVFKGRIEDKFTPVLRKKMEYFGAEMIGHEICDDDHEAVTAAIRRFLSEGAEIVLCTGGMSVDPDDKTPLAIRNTGARIVSYGAPVLPGAMFMLAYTEDGRAVMGLPGCVMYAGRTVFDIVLPRIMADVEVTQEALSVLGEGGLCLNCEVCTYPNCGFGKGC